MWGAHKFQTWTGTKSNEAKNTGKDMAQGKHMAATTGHWLPTAAGLSPRPPRTDPATSPLSLKGQSPRQEHPTGQAWSCAHSPVARKTGKILSFQRL